MQSPHPIAAVAMELNGGETLSHCVRPYRQISDINCRPVTSARVFDV